jgi:hypothetical protein
MGIEARSSLVLVAVFPVGTTRRRRRTANAEHPLDNLKGRSGGPIVSLSDVDRDGIAWYRLVALQGTTMGSGIKGTLMSPSGRSSARRVKRPR